MTNSRRRFLSFAAVWAGASASIAWGATLPGGVQTEVAQLLAFVETSGCEFYRNGSWHDSRSAREHLTMKYEYMVKRDMLKSADDFITKAASSSNMSGSAYKVRCGGGEVITSAQWLREELARLRAKRLGQAS